MSRVLVTGANGFVGKHMKAMLLKHGDEVLSVSGQSAAKHSSPEEHVTNLQIDLTDPRSVDRIDFKSLDSVVHLAGLAAVGPSFESPMRYITTNMGIESNLLEATLRQSANPRFLIISSGSLYDPSAPLPIRESANVLPSSPYSVSKLGQEQLAAYYVKRGLDCIIARPFNHIGPGQNSGFIVPDLMQQLLAVESGIRNEILVGNLEPERDYTDVRDIVEAYWLLLAHGETGEVYNVCSGTPRSGKDVLDALLSLCRVAPKIVRDETKLRPYDTPRIFGSYQKLSEQTGWSPKIAFETTLTDAFSDWRTRSAS